MEKIIDFNNSWSLVCRVTSSCLCFRCSDYLARSTLGRAGKTRPCPACRRKSSENPALYTWQACVAYELLKMTSGKHGVQRQVLTGRNKLDWKCLRKSEHACFWYVLVQLLARSVQDVTSSRVTCDVMSDCKCKGHILTYVRCCMTNYVIGLKSDAKWDVSRRRKGQITAPWRRFDQV